MLDPIEDNNSESSPDFVPDEDEVSVTALDEPHLDGEYSFTDIPDSKIYSDAHYTPASEDTTPPRYYIPPEHPVKEKKERNKKSGGFAKTVCACLVCAILGGIGGASLVAGSLSKKLDELEKKSNTPVLSSSGSVQPSAIPVPTSSSALLPSQIYELGCTQSVGITTEVTYTNFFGQTSSSAVSGSGFVATADGYIITNYHVIEYAHQYGYEISVMFKDGSSYTAAIVGVEEDNDIAVLKIEAQGLSPVTFGDSDALYVGDVVYAVGNPLGELDFTMTTGSVTALDREITTSESTSSINMYQIDAAVNEGNSGGPLYNAVGEVVGVVSAKSSGTGIEGIGFAIPINDVVSIANDLMTKGYVTGKAYMGVSIDSRYTEVYSQYYNMPMGAYIYTVESGSGAEAAGIQRGDIITKLGEYDVTSSDTLTQAVRKFSAGDTTQVVIYRNSEYITLDITFGEAKPSENTQSSAQQPQQQTNPFTSNPFGWGF